VLIAATGRATVNAELVIVGLVGPRRPHDVSHGQPGRLPRSSAVLPGARVAENADPGAHLRVAGCLQRRIA
jgi:hypothetical protein